MTTLNRHASDTPRTDAIARREHRNDSGERAAKEQDASDMTALARQLERELAAATAKPPCQHSHQSGWVKGSEWDMKCDDCGEKLGPNTLFSKGFVMVKV